jgi:hypothetical protein
MARYLQTDGVSADQYCGNDCRACSSLTDVTDIGAHPSAMALVRSYSAACAVTQLITSWIAREEGGRIDLPPMQYMP